MFPLVPAGAPQSRPGIAREKRVLEELHDEFVATVKRRAELKSSTRLQCACIRTISTYVLHCLQSTRREKTIRPKISRIDFDVTELERFFLDGAFHDDEKAEELLD